MSDESGPSLPGHADPAVYRAGLAWWRRTAAALGRLPARRDFHPADLGAAALPHVLLVDILGNADELRFRLMGTAHVEFNARDLTGLKFSEVYPADSPVLAYVKELYREMIDKRRPLWSLNQLVPPGRDIPILMERLMLPLSSDGARVDLCLAIQKVSYELIPNAYPRHPWHTAHNHGQRERILL